MCALSGKPQPTQNGFTLLEIMVALAIFSLAALAMVRLQGYSPPTLGETRGEEMNGGQNWRWTATASPTDDTRLVMIDIDVVGTGNAALRKARLTIARPVEQ
jgi:general secretion pathway protein I